MLFPVSVSMARHMTIEFDSSKYIFSLLDALPARGNCFNGHFHSDPVDVYAICPISICIKWLWTDTNGKESFFFSDPLFFLWSN